MLELTAENAAEILQSRGWLPQAAGVRVQELSGGVSNAVFLVETPADRFVVKQARGKLRVQADWQCSVERIWREVEVLQGCLKLLQHLPQNLISVPRLLWLDRDLYAYGMTAADANSQTWKEQLLNGQVDCGAAWSAGTLLSTLHAASWNNSECKEHFKDRAFFGQLRLEPYYLVAAENYRPLANQLSALVDQTWRTQHALVHGDFSPKNLLVISGTLMLIDFEVGHYGDPAFDLGFFLTHLTLKAIHLPQHRLALLDVIRTFMGAYTREMYREIHESENRALLNRTTQHLAGCLVARVHGKSPVDYLTPSEQLQAVALAEKLFDLGPTATWEESHDLLCRELV